LSRSSAGIIAGLAIIGRQGGKEAEREDGRRSGGALKPSRRFLDIVTIKGESDVGEQRQRANGKETGEEAKRRRNRGTERNAPSRDAGGLAGGSALAGRACVNKRPSAVMAVSATSDAFRWLFSPGCLGVA
jgi:hypothetical protein